MASRGSAAKGEIGYSRTSLKLNLWLFSNGAGGMMVTSPNGGEKITAGTAYEIEWTGLQDEAKYVLSHSLDGGQKWQTIAASVKVKIRPWKVPKPSTTKTECLVRVLAYNAQGSFLPSDDSNQTLTIQVVSQPEGGNEPGVSGNVATAAMVVIVFITGHAPCLRVYPKSFAKRIHGRPKAWIVRFVDPKCEEPP